MRRSKEVGELKDHPTLREEPNMRLVAVVAAAFIAGSPAVAEEWQEYAYPDYAFTVRFPASPRVETTTWQAAGGGTVPARVYSVRQNSGAFTATVAETGKAGLDEEAVIGHAIRTLSTGAEVKVNMPHRIYRVYGRQLSIRRPDGSASTVALFVHNGRFYQVEGQMAAGGSPIDVLLFQQSLVFTDGGSNRSDEAIRAMREACRGLANVRNAAGNPVQPAGPDDPRCEVRARE
jgi:hypothetical protein